MLLKRLNKNVGAWPLIALKAMLVDSSQITSAIQLFQLSFQCMFRKNFLVYLIIAIARVTFDVTVEGKF